MTRTKLSDYLIDFLENDANKNYTVIFRNLSQAIKLAVKNKELSNVLPYGFYSVVDSKPVQADESRTDSRGLVQDFWILNKEEFEIWFLKGSSTGTKPFLSKGKKAVKKDVSEMTNEEFEEEFKRYQEKLNTVPKTRAKRTS
jgi:predicted metal-dependent hydrolase